MQESFSVGEGEKDKVKEGKEKFNDVHGHMVPEREFNENTRYEYGAVGIADNPSGRVKNNWQNKNYRV